MSKDKTKKESGTPKRKKTKLQTAARISKITLIILFVATIIYTLCQPAIEDAKYTKFLEQLNSGQVASATLNFDSGTVIYTLNDENATQYKTTYPDTDDFIETLLLKDVDVDFITENPVAVFFRYYFSPILVALMFGMLIYIQSKSMSSSSNAQVIKPETRFSDVAGMEEAKEDLLTLSRFLKDEKYRKAGVRVPKGVLLQGPPGNGKTLLARAFAGEADVNFIAVNAADMSSPFVGMGSMKIKKLFEQAKKQAPCVVFIDELDAVGSKRGDRDDSASREMNAVVTALLSQMDGFTPADNVMVIAATNRAENLDDALVRPGRFDRQLIVTYPDKHARIELIHLYAKKANRELNVNVERLAAKTYGYSCSKIECIVNEAVINSLARITDDNSAPALIEDDFAKAILQIDIKGKIKKNKDRNEEDKRITAYHEAGHAVLTYFLTDKKVSEISISPTTSGAGGFTVTEFNEDKSLRPIKDYRNEITMMYGGRAAEYVLGEGDLKNVSGGAVQDIHEATKLATTYIQLRDGFDYAVFGDHGIDSVMDESKKLLAECWAEASKVAEDKWNYVEKVAEYLIENENINADNFIKLMEETA